MNQDQSTNHIFTTPEAATYLGIAVSTLNKWRCYGNDGPAFLKLGKAVRYRQQDLDAFIKSHTVGTINYTQGEQ